MPAECSAAPRSGPAAGLLALLADLGAAAGAVGHTTVSAGAERTAGSRTYAVDGKCPSRRPARQAPMT